MDKKQEVINTLKEYNQDHIIRLLEKINEKKQNELIKQIQTIDFHQIMELYNNTKKEIKFKESKIEPLEYLDKAKLTETQKAKFDKLGEETVKKGEYAVVTMAGGQGTRLGHPGPKGTFKLDVYGKGKYLFEILVDNLKEANQKYGTTISWYIMTSKENNDATVKFFEDHDYFGYPKDKVVFFKQGQLPMIDTKGKVLIGEDGLIKQSADGHGGIFLSMKKNGIIYDMKSRGIEWAFIGGVDNVLVNMVDPVLLGLAIDKKVLAAGKSVVKAGPHEKVGVFCKRNGKPSVVEYSEISEEMAEATIRMLLDLIRKKHKSRHLVFEGQLIEGQSVRNIRENEGGANYESKWNTASDQ